MTDVRNYHAEDELKDGRPVTIRAMRAADLADVLAAFRALDEEAIYTRFFTYKKALSDTELKQITDVDFDRVVALIITTNTDGLETLVGGGRYVSGDEPGPARSAELAFLTGNDYRRRGVASLILKHLIRIGREAGLSKFEADVLAQNQAMLSVFRKSGLPISTRADGGVQHVTLDLTGEKSEN